MPQLDLVDLVDFVINLIVNLITSLNYTLLLVLNRMSKLFDGQCRWEAVIKSALTELHRVLE